MRELGLPGQKGDVNNAFLQGGSYEDELYAEPVEELRRALKLKPGECVKLLKAIYGLAEAPRYWRRRCHADLLKLGFEDLISEPCVYAFRGEDGSLIGLAVVYVDDIMIGFVPGNEVMENIFQQVQDLYEWGVWESGDFMQTGGRVRQHYNSKRRASGVPSTLTTRSISTT